MKKYLRILILFLIISSCQNDDEGYVPLIAEENEQYSGGDFTIFNSSSLAFDFSGPTLSIADQQRFGIGDSFFDQSWVTAPASTSARDGLGPLFNARACAGCHFRDGRGRPPVFDGELSHGLLLQLSNGINSPITGPQPHPVYGNQLQDQGLLGLTPEGSFRIEYTTITGSYADGTTYELRKPNYIIEDLAYGNIGTANISPRVGPQVIGMGLLGAISDADILANEDVNDSNGDGISGKANYVWNVEENQVTLGKYGWKANQPTLAQQNASAFSGDLGITSPLFPDENCTTGADCSPFPNGGTPELTQSGLDDVTFYTATLSVPARRDWEEQNVLRGKQLFNDMQCASCHIAQFTTSNSAIASELSNQTIRPYTDLLLHDMGEDLADNSEQFLANGREWRTPPLWGLGLIETVNGHTFLLHDGRARNIEEAILWHGGEAEASKQQFKTLFAEDRQDVLDFLNSL